MGQLAAAIKGLKGLAAAVKGMPAAVPQVPDGTPDASKDETPTSDGKQAPSDDVLELLATLGLTLVPAPQTAPLTAPLATDAAPGAKAPVALQPALMLPPEVNPKAAQQPAADMPQPSKPQQAGQHVATPELDLPNGHVPVDAPQAAATPVEPQPVAQPHTAQAQPTAVTPQLTTLPPELQQGQTGSAFQHSSNGNTQHGHAEAKADSLTMQAVPERVYADAAASAVPTTDATANAPRADSQAVQVANQIAQQVDLYRLPGNKGVRIQLHPEELGGVQVTLKYATGGTLELHINVEHASTGNLVQEGLNHLRDALATQGFHPDRMVMSISAPSASSQMDFNSNNSGSYRSDPGLNAFMQDNQSSQQRSGGDDQRNASGWTFTTDTSSASDDAPRTGSTPSAGNSVIDYRV
jgi:flagellar hook-length control protein FliK